jgi:hypothetical protein
LALGSVRCFCPLANGTLGLSAHLFLAFVLGIAGIGLSAPISVETVILNYETLFDQLLQP